jgi:hypothetical protein
LRPWLSTAATGISYCAALFLGKSLLCDMSSQLIRFKPYTLLLYNSFWEQEYTFADNFLALAALVKWPLACQVPEDGNSRSIDIFGTVFFAT